MPIFPLNSLNRLHTIAKWCGPPHLLDGSPIFSFVAAITNHHTEKGTSLCLLSIFPSQYSFLIDEEENKEKKVRGQRSGHHHEWLPSIRGRMDRFRRGTRSDFLSPGPLLAMPFLNSLLRCVIELWLLWYHEGSMLLSCKWEIQIHCAPS